METVTNIKKSSLIIDPTIRSEYENIPIDYKGLMGVPVSFMHKYNPKQFEILGQTDRGGDGMLEDYKKKHTQWGSPVVNGRKTYTRILIRHRKI